MVNFAALQPASVVSHRDSLLMALLLAIVLHAFILLGMKGDKEPPQADKAIDITLISLPSIRIQKRVYALAMLNQEGGGQKRSKPTPPPHQEKQVVEMLQKKMPPKTPEPETQPLPKSQATQKIIITQKVSATKPVVTAEKIAQQEKIETVERNVVKETPRPLLSSADLELQIAQLGRDIAKKQPSEDDSRIKPVNAIGAHQYLASQYISDWQDKVERIGNINYPEIARKKGFTGKLILDVGIKTDGSIYNMRISKSSGYTELDEAAKKIVQMSAPFSALPKELRNELDVLEIKRVWSFSDETGMSTD